ncbi:Small ubiquitin-related modifier 1 [Citrus sinensis]|nr:Small ubiquitin-related modifier 1 [Citrus sinensis]
MSATGGGGGGGGGQEEDKKPVDQSAHINLKVKGQDGNEVFFRIKRSTQLKKLMNAYCDRQSVELNSIAFLFDGRRLRGEQTPDELEMEDGDEIDAMLHQTGDGELRVGNIAGKIWLSVSHCACYTLYLVPGVEEPRRIILPVLSS